MSPGSSFRLSVLAALCLLPVPALAGRGGGYTASGLRGEYFANTALTAPASFKRRDVRIRFSGPYSVAGSNTPEFRAFPVSGWSARWTGQLLPRYTEAYMLSVTSNDSLRVSTKDPASQTWSPLIDHWASAAERASTRTASISATAGKPIDIRIEYRDISGPATLRVSWKSASTPEEVIDPVAQNGLNIAGRALFADACYMGRNTWEKNLAMDALGNPQGDGTYVAWEGGDVQNLGTYRVTFKGRADVSIGMRCAQFFLGGRWVDLFPSGAGYDPTTNTTTALMHVTNGAILYFEIKNSQRTVDAPIGSGITDLHIFRPVEPRSDTPQEVSAVTNAAFKPAAELCTTLRYLDNANGFHHPKPTWADRTRPSWHVFNENWEALIELANETGKDLYITTPVNADNDYFTKLAQLIAYGSDGINPYTAPQANPTYPPLNSNLCVYFEVGNEIWNWGFPSSHDAADLASAEIKANTDESKIFNYDGKGNYRTWHALRTVRASEAFRRIMGDDAFGDRFRPLIEYQYNNYQDTAIVSLAFIDAYFNNGDGNHVPTPHPVRYYIWGGGGATYYGVGNNDGTQDDIKLADPSFEIANIPDGTEVKCPAGSDWAFTGDAGIYRLNSLAYTTGEKPTNDTLQANSASGMRFKTGNRPIFVKQFGRFTRPNSTLGEFYLFRASDMSLLARGSGGNIQPPFLASWKDDFYYTEAKPAQGAGPVALDPNAEYIVVATGLNKNLDGREASTPLIGSPDVQIEAPVTARVSGDDPSKWACKPGTPGASSADLVTFTYRTSAADAPSLATVINGQQAAILRGTGSIAQTVNFLKPGAYALQFHAAGAGAGWPGYLNFTIWCDEQSASPSAQSDCRINPTGVGLGGFARDIKSLREEWGSAVFVIKTPGPHTIRFASKGKPTEWTAIDDVEITSVDAIMDSGFGAGSAYGQVAANNYQKQLNSQALYALSFGLPVVAYEAGWCLGGDFGAKPIQTYCKYFDSRARTINNAAAATFNASGGYLNCWGVYLHWPDIDFDHPERYPLVQSIIDQSNRLPAAQTNGVSIPATLTPANAVPWAASSGNFEARGKWASWIVNVPNAGSYTLSVTTSPAAQYELETDGLKLAPVNGAYTVTLAQGSHGIRIRSTTQDKWSVTSIAVK